MPRTGRPATAQAKFTRNAFEGLLEIGATQQEICHVMGISEPALTRAMKKEYGRNTTFVELAAIKSATVKMSLRRRVLQGAFAGDKTMLIFAAKVYGGMSERVIVRQDPQQFAEQQDREDRRTVVAVAMEQQRLEKLRAILLGATGRVAMIEPQRAAG